MRLRLALAVSFEGAFVLQACAASKPPAEHAPPADLTPPALFCRPSAEEPTGETPTREDVIGALTPLRSSIAECHERGHAQVKLEFVSSGCLQSLPHVTLTGVEASRTAEVSACVQRVAVAARLKPFRRAKFFVSFPFVLRSND